MSSATPLSSQWANIRAMNSSVSVVWMAWRKSHFHTRVSGEQSTLWMVKPVSTPSWTAAMRWNTRQMRTKKKPFNWLAVRNRSNEMGGNVHIHYPKIIMTFEHFRWGGRQLHGQQWNNFSHQISWKLDVVRHHSSRMHSTQLVSHFKASTNKHTHIQNWSNYIHLHQECPIMVLEGHYCACFTCCHPSTHLCQWLRYLFMFCRMLVITRLYKLGVLEQRNL